MFVCAQPVLASTPDPAAPGLLRLRDLRKELIAAESELGPEVLETFATLPLHSSAEERVVAAILGMSDR
nr:hypothetical protein [Thioalkalivibrio sp. ALE11]